MEWKFIWDPKLFITSTPITAQILWNAVFTYIQLFEDIFKWIKDIFKSFEDIFNSFEDIFKWFKDIFKSFEDIFKWIEDSFKGTICRYL